MRSVHIERSIQPYDRAYHGNPQVSGKDVLRFSGVIAFIDFLVVLADVEGG